MKNIYIALAITALFSCNKENKTAEKTDSKTGKNTTVESSTPSSDTTLQENVQTLAISDSLGIYRQKLHLEIGKVYPFTTHQKDISTTKMPDGKSQSITRESTDVIEFKPVQLQNGVYDIDIHFVSKKTSQNGMGMSQTVDTKTPAPKDEGLKNRWSIDKAMTGNILKMKMKENGEIISIKGFEEVYKKIQNTIASLTKEKEQQKAVSEQIKASFNEKVIREQFAKNIFVFPKKGVKIGGTWSHSENASADGKIKLTSNYTLKKVEGNIAEITVSGGIPKQSNKATQQGITQTVSSELSQNGSYQFDTQSGWLKHQKVTVKISDSQSFSDGNKTESMSNTTVTTVTVNP